MAQAYVYSRYPALRGWAGISSLIWLIRGSLGLLLAAVAYNYLGQYGMNRLQLEETGHWMTVVLYALVGQYSWIFTLISVFFVAMWCAHISHQLEELGVGGFYYSPVGTFSAFFIPILNLARAYYAIRDLYLTFSPELLYNTAGIRHRPQAPLWLPLWWCLTVAAMLEAYIISRFMLHLDDADLLANDFSLTMLLTAGLGIFVQSSCWVIMIWVIERRQQTYLGHLFAAAARGKDLRELDEPYHVTYGRGDWD